MQNMPAGDYTLQMQPVPDEGYHISEPYLLELDLDALVPVDTMPLDELTGYLQRSAVLPITIIFLSEDPANVPQDPMVELVASPHENVIYAHLMSESQVSLFDSITPPAHAVVVTLFVGATLYVAAKSFLIAGGVALVAISIPPIIEALRDTFETLEKSHYAETGFHVAEYLHHEITGNESEESAPDMPEEPVPDIPGDLASGKARSTGLNWSALQLGKHDRRHMGGRQWT